MTVGPRTSRRRNPRGSGEQLRAEIIAVTKDLLAASGDSGAVSIRAVAEAVGVTSPSIYLHFADKDALLEAVVADVLAELDETMQAAARGIEDPMEVLCAYGLAYVRFAIDHPEHYRLATMERAASTDGASHLDTVLAEAAFTHFVTTVTECMAQGIFAEGDPIPVTLAAWSSAHGVASLLITKPYLPWGDPMDFARTVLCSSALGYAINDVYGHAIEPRDIRGLVQGIRDQRNRPER